MIQIKNTRTSTSSTLVPGKPGSRPASAQRRVCQNSGPETTAPVALPERAAFRPGTIMLEAANLECVRGSRTLFSGVGFSVARSALLRVIGSNGSGKTSLARMLCGLLLPMAGEVRWKG